MKFIYGRGLNSIRWRFMLASAVLTFAGVAARDKVLVALGTNPWWRGVSLVVLVALIAGITLLMASRLTGLIASLERSTEAIASGDFDAPIDVDCACEVGGLANSFRKMTSRMNANVLRMNALAYTDAITGLPNRSVINHLLSYALAPERAGSFRAAIIFIDLDGFKRINDTLGHGGGDELLHKASRRILEKGLNRTIDSIDDCMEPFGNPCDRLPQDIVLARFAGDEFVAILPGVTDQVALAAISERIVASLALPFRIKNQEVSVGASLGIAITPDDTRSAEELLSFADMAMYSSKQAGKARFRFFDRHVRELMIQNTQTEAELREALHRNELLLYWQPKLDMQTGVLAGAEALVRWQHPTRGLLLPASFIDLAERSGQMAQLGERVLTMAIAQCRAWLDADMQIEVAVNVSPSQFADPAFVDLVLTTLQDANVPPRLLSIEITESMAMVDFDATIGRLSRLRKAGVRIALDDFGIGYSNLSQLSRLPLDDLKIDRSLVEGIGTDDKSEAVIGVIIGMTGAMGYRTIAEGIETEAQYQALCSMGCALAQGFLLARPMPASALQQWQLRQPAATAVT